MLDLGAGFGVGFHEVMSGVNCFWVASTLGAAAAAFSALLQLASRQDQLNTLQK